MRIRGIEIANFRNLREVRLTPAPLAVIIGENGSGKSNLLHALRLLFDPAARQLQAALSESDINADALAAGENHFKVQVQFGDLGPHADLKAVFTEWLDKAPDGEEFVTILGYFGPDESGELEWEATVEPPKGSKSKPGAFTRRMHRMLPLLFLDPVRDASSEARVMRGSLLERLVRDVDLSSVAEDVSAALAEADEKLSGAPDLELLRSNLEASAKALLPGGQASVGLSIAGHETKALLRTLQIILSARSGEPGLPAQRHGTGFQNLLLLAMYKSLRQHHADVHPMLAVEEPEAHLHPHAQRRLLRELSTLDAPTLVTTHAPAVAASTPPTGIIRLHASSASATSAHQLPHDGLTEDEARHFELLIRNGRSDVFFARAAVLVEGRSEALAVPAFAEVLGLDLDRDGVTILDAGGNGFEYVLRVLHEDALNVPVVVLYDTDVLMQDAKLCRLAHRLGLVSKADLGPVLKDRADVAADREALLAKAGWIAAPGNFEHVVCEHGYLDAVLSAIDSEGKTERMDSFLRDGGHAKDAAGVSAFVGKMKTLKISVAEAVALAANESTGVPPCFEAALNRAVALAVS